MTVNECVHFQSIHPLSIISLFTSCCFFDIFLCLLLLLCLVVLLFQAVDPAVELLNQKERKKFFNKYSQISQDLEKCLDFLLVLSDTVANPRDDSDESGTQCLAEQNHVFENEMHFS